MPKGATVPRVRLHLTQPLPPANHVRPMRDLLAEEVRAREATTDRRATGRGRLEAGEQQRCHGQGHAGIVALAGLNQRPTRLGRGCYSRRLRVSASLPHGPRHARCLGNGRRPSLADAVARADRGRALHPWNARACRSARGTTLVAARTRLLGVGSGPLSAPAPSVRGRAPPRRGRAGIRAAESTPLAARRNALHASRRS